MGCLFVLLAVATGGNLAPALSQEPEPLSPDFQITLAELGYEEKTLTSPYDAIEYTLRLPEDWELREGSFFELDFDYAYNYIGALEAQPALSFFGDVIIVIDGYRQQTFSIREAALEHARLRVGLSPDLINTDRRAHTIEVILDAGHICRIPHVASLTIHPISFFSLIYDRVPLVPDLSRYPYPFYQRAFEPDQVRFVLPAHPTEMELTGAVGVAAKLGDLTYGMVISGTSDLELTERLEAGDALREHLIVIGRPENNEVILRLNELDALPLPLKERQLSLASQGPAAVAPGSILSYTLTFTNTTQASIAALSLVDTLPAYGQMINCDPECSDTGEGEIGWSIPPLEVGEAFKCAVELRLSDVLTDAVIENTVTLLDAVSGPLNVSTLTTTVSTTSLAESGLRASVSTDEGYFFYQGERAVPENDGVVQEIVSPWDQARAILVITGLNDEAVHKAAQAMSFESRFPGMAGQFALVREVRAPSMSRTESLGDSVTFAELGYEDRVLEGFSQESIYYFDLPIGWRLTEEAALDLRFSHSQLLEYGISSLGVLFNNKPIATVTLSEETSLNGGLNVQLPASLSRPGERNQISVQASLKPFDVCAHLDVWLLVSRESQLYLSHDEQQALFPLLDTYPYPFDQRSDLSDVLLVLPPEPQTEEWERALKLVASLGSASGGADLSPKVAIGDALSEGALADYHIVAVGRPSRNPLIRQINAQLPQPFQPGSDKIEQRLNDVVLRLPPDLSLGFVQLIPSPWNEARSLLAVTGTNDEGVRRAVDVLAERPWAVKGNLSFVTAEGEVSTVDTRGLTSSGIAAAVSTAVPELTPATPTTETLSATPAPLAQATPSPAYSNPTPAETNRPGWLIPLVAAMGLAVIAIFAIALWQSRRAHARN